MGYFGASVPDVVAFGGIFTYHDGNMNMIFLSYFRINNIVETNLLIITNVITDNAKVSVSKSGIVIEKLIVQLVSLLIFVQSIRE